MPLQKQDVDFVFTTGTDESSDERISTGLSVAENVRFDVIGKLSKQYGYDEVTSATSNIYPAAIINNNNVPFLTMHQSPSTDTIPFPYLTGVVSNNSGTLQANDFANVFFPRVKMVSHDCGAFPGSMWDPAIKVFHGCVDGDHGMVVAANNGYTSPNLYISFFDAKRKISKRSVTRTRGSNILGVQCLNNTKSVGYLVYFWQESNTIYMGRYSTTADPSVVISDVSVATNVNSLARWDVCYAQHGGSDYAYVLFLNNSTVDRTIEIKRVNIATGSVSAGFTNTLSATINCLSLSSPKFDGSNIDAIRWVAQNNTSGVQALSLNPDLSSALSGVTNLDTSITSTVNRLTSSCTSSVMSISWERNGTMSDDFRRYVTDRSATITTSTFSMTADIFYHYGMSLVTKECIGSSAPLKILQHENGSQLTYFLAVSGISQSLTKNVGCIIKDNGCPTTSTTMKQLPSFLAYDDGTIMSFLSKFTSNSNVYGVSTNTYSSAVISGEFLENGFITANTLNGALVGNGDLSLIEPTKGLMTNGFYIYPKIVSVGSLPAGAVANGTYSLIACYQYEDSFGQVHYSEFSDPVSYTLSGVNGTIDVVVSTYRLNDKGACKILLYSTTNGGTIYYLAGKMDNTPSTETLNIVRIEHDNTISAYARAEISDGREDSFQVASPYALAASQTRLFAVSGDEPSIVRCSKQFRKGRGLSFCSYKGIVYDGGPITALATIDDKVIVFKESSIFAAFGDGPDDTGANNNLSEFRKISFEAGCTSHRSVMATSNGVYFVHNDSLWLVGRDLSVRPVGNKNRSLSGNIMSAHDIPNNELLFCEKGASVIHHYSLMYDSWTTKKLTTHAANDTEINDICAIDSDIFVVVKRADTNTKLLARSTSQIDMGYQQSNLVRIATQWIRPASFMNGFIRLYATTISGTANGAGSMNVNVYYDNDESSPETHELSFSNSEKFRVQVRHAKQKISSVKFVITDKQSGTDDPYGFSFDISSLSMSVGMMPGGARIRESRRG